MSKKTFVPLVLAGLFAAAASVFATDAKVTITSVSPKEPYNKDKITLQYEAVVAETGNHLHLNVDGKRVDVIRQLKGTATLDPLPSGKHHICLAENTPSHVATGVEGCVDVTVW